MLLKKSSVLLNTCLILLSTLNVAAYAQYAVSPTRIFIQPARHGKSAAQASSLSYATGPYITGTSVVRVANTSNEPVRLKAYLENWSMDSSGQMLPADKQDPFTLADRVMINPMEFEVSPGQNKAVRLLISIPKDLPDGEYHGMLFFENLKTDLETQEMKKGVSMAVTLKYRSGCGVYFYKGVIEPKVVISEFSVTPGDHQLKTHLLLSNTGTQHARVQASVLLTHTDPATGTVEPKGTVPIAGHAEILLLPGKSRVIDQVLSPSKEVNLLEPGSYNAQITVIPTDTAQQALIKMKPVTQTQSVQLDQPIKGSI